MENEKDEIEKFNPYLGNGRRKKHFFEDILKPILSGLGGIILVGLFILGEYHSCTKHKDDSDLMIYTPLAIYRGVEIFWHNDFAGVNWDERLKEDAKSCVYFLNSSIDESANPHEVSKNLEIFAKDVSKYPKDKLEVLKSFSKTYIEYQKTFASDISEATKYYLSYGENTLTYSGKVREMGSRLSKYLPKEFFEQLISTSEISYKELGNVFPKLDELDENIRSERVKDIERRLNYGIVNLLVTYKKMFNQDFK